MKTYPAMPKRDVAEHANIFAAICDNNPKRARNEMVKHIKSFAKLVISVDPIKKIQGQIQRELQQGIFR